MKKFIIIIKAILFLIVLYFVYMLITPNKIDLTFIGTVKSDVPIKNVRWAQIRDEGAQKYVEKEFNFKIIMDIDYEREYVIVSCGSEIKELSYTFISKYGIKNFYKTYIGRPIYKETFTTDVIYIYTMKRFDLVDEEDLKFKD